MRITTLIAIGSLATLVVAGCGRRRSPPPPSQQQQGAGVAPMNNNQGGDPSGGVQGGSTGGAAGYFYQVLPSKNAKFNQAYRPLFDSSGYEGQTVARMFNQHIAWPRNVTLAFHDCGTVNAFYQKGTHSVNMCYELTDFFSTSFSSSPQTKSNPQKHLLDAMVFTQLHESGHALIGEFDMGVPGGEEEAVDDFAALFLIKHGDPQSAYDGAVAMRMLNKLSGNKPTYFDVHPYGDQRYFNVLCLIYASNPQKYAGLVGDPNQGFLPKQRAAGCADEFHKKDKYWSTQLAPHSK